MKVSINLNAQYSVQMGLVHRSQIKYQTKWWINLEVLVDKWVNKVCIVLWVTSKIIELVLVVRCKLIILIKEFNIDKKVLIDLVNLKCKLKINNFYKVQVVPKVFPHQQELIQLLWQVFNKICILAFYQTIFY